MASCRGNFILLLLCLIGAATLCNGHGHRHRHGHHHHHSRRNQIASIVVNASEGRPIPDKLFGIFFEEINHAGAGGLWAELVSNRGFEAGGLITPSYIGPWDIIGNSSSICAWTELSSVFEHNKVALRVEVLCDDNTCPSGGVGIYNPGYWGMNIVKGKAYKVVFYARSSGPTDVAVSITSANGSKVLATSNIIVHEDWTKVEATLVANDSDTNARLQFTTTKKGVIWFDQVSAMPTDTYKGHGFRTDLMEMLINLEPAFLRFPGGCYVQGTYLRNAYRWKETVGPWEERPGHFGDVWMYWSDDGLGYYAYLLLAEDLNAEPIWVINNGMSLNESVSPSSLGPFIQEMLDSIEFARGNANTTWGSVRAAMGHPEPFNLKYIAIGNEQCGLKYYQESYVLFYNALKQAYPDIKAISNCDASSKPLDHPADLYDFHVYTSADSMFAGHKKFDNVPRSDNLKAFVSEYAVWKETAGNGSLLAALGEAAFLIGLERNSDHVNMSCYAPLFVHVNDRRWIPDAIVFNSSHAYGTPSYWMQHFFKESNGATFLNSTLEVQPSDRVVASAISWKNSKDNREYITIKIVNYGHNNVHLEISFIGLDDPNALTAANKTVLTSANVMDENSLENPTKIVPVTYPFELKDKGVLLEPHSFTALDFVKAPSHIHQAV